MFNVVIVGAGPGETLVVAAHGPDRARWRADHPGGGEAGHIQAAAAAGPK